jgi:AraC-like DNA-binding protein
MLRVDAARRTLVGRNKPFDGDQFVSARDRVQPWMEETDASGVPCYSMHLVRPFVQLLAEHPGLPRESIDELLAMDPDERMPCAVAHQMQAFCVQQTGDADIGLKAAALVAHGDAGAIDYLLASGATVQDAISLAGRYMRLVNDVLDLRLQIAGERAEVHLEPKLPVPRATTDFGVASFFRNHVRGWVRGKAPGLEDLTVFFSYPAPESSAEYEKLFAPARVVFGAAFSGYSFDEALLEAPLERADSKLNHVMKQHAQKTLDELPKTQTWTDRVRTLVAEELAGGDPTAAHVARKLGLSSRTLGRKLEREGTTFSDLFDDLRRRLALQYVGSRDLNLSEVALLLGFSQTAAFHRAFRRWTDRTPLQYRRAPKK